MRLGSLRAGASSPNTLVELVRTNARTPTRSASSSSVNVPVTLVSTNCWRVCVARCGLCSVAAWKTTSAPRIASRTHAGSATEPTTSVYGDLTISRPTAGRARDRRTRTSASPRCPALPVTTTTHDAPESTFWVARLSIADRPLVDRSEQRQPSASVDSLSVYSLSRGVTGNRSASCSARRCAG